MDFLGILEQEEIEEREAVVRRTVEAVRQVTNVAADVLAEAIRLYLEGTTSAVEIPAGVLAYSDLADYNQATMTGINMF